MTLLLADSTTAALAIAGIGFLGVLVGGGLGLLGTLVTTSKQIQREERDLRRNIYADYLARALECSTLLQKQNEQYERISRTRAVHNHLVEESRQSYNAGSIDYIKAEAIKARVPAVEASDELTQLLAQFENLNQVFQSRAHELKIHAPDLVHDAAQLVYRTVGLRTRFNVPEHPEPTIWRRVPCAYSRPLRERMLVRRMPRDGQR